MDVKPPCRKSLGLEDERILWYLLGKKDVKPVIPSGKDRSLDKDTRKLSFTLSNDQNRPSHVTSPPANHVSLFDSYAYKSFPPEVQLCWSSIPGNEFGVVATCVIPKGVWIGPYEGKLVDINEVDKCEDRTNMWEIFHQNQLRYFIDGTDVRTTSWMMFIQCARHKTEQNTSAFQYQGRVYYRVLRDIHVGEEILVWYDDCYEQYMGVPVMKQPTCIGNNCLDESKKSRKIKSTSSLQLHLKTIKESVEVVSKLTQNKNSDAEQTGLTGSSQSGLTDDISIDTSIDSHYENSSSNHSNSPDRKMSSHQGSSPNCHSNGSSPNSNNDTSHDNDEEPSKCSQCCKIFPQRVMLQMHLCPKQANSPYHCGQCPSSFTNPSDLRGHVVHHVGQKPFKCGFCNRSFVGATTLNNHIQIHTGKKRFLSNNSNVLYRKRSYNSS